MIVKDTVEQATVTKTRDGASATRRFIVSDIGGQPEVRALAALDAPDVPVINEPYPGGIALFVENKTVTALEPDIFEVVVNYAPFKEGPENQEGEQGAIISVGGSLTSQQTTFDKDGNEIFVGPIEGLPNPEFFENGNLDVPTQIDLPAQAGVVNVQVPQYKVRFQRKENDSPELKAKNNVGKVNSVQFLGVPEKKVLCTSITGTSNDGGETYSVSYEFQVNLDDNGWTVGVVYIDRETGLPLKGANVDDGTKKVVDVYQEVDFNALNLQ